MSWDHLCAENFLLGHGGGVVDGAGGGGGEGWEDRDDDDPAWTLVYSFLSLSLRVLLFALLHPSLWSSSGMLCSQVPAHDCRSPKGGRERS